MDALHTALNRLRRRLALFQWVHFCLAGLLYSTVASVVWLVLTRLFPLLGQPEPVCGAIFALGLLAATYWAWRQRPTLLDAAMAADRRLGLKERLTSSLALHQADGPMIAALHADARAHLERLHIRRDFPLLIPARLRWAAAAAVVYGVAYLLFPEFDLFGYQQRAVEARQEREVRQVHAERIEDAVRVLKESELEGLAVGSEMAEAIQRVAEELRMAEVTDKQALAKLSNLADELEKQREALAGTEGLPMPELAEMAPQSDLGKALAEALESGDLDKAMEKLDALAEQLGQGGEELSDEAKSDMAEDLQALADALGGAGADSALAEALSQAAAGMQQGDMDAVKDALNQTQMSIADVKSALEQMKQMDEAAKKLAQAAGAMKQPCGTCQGKGCAACNGTGMGPGGDKAGTQGNWQAGTGPMGGGGMGQRGRGRGGSVGDLPEGEVAFDPSFLPGEVSSGDVIAQILQRTRPDEADAQSSLEYTPPTLAEVTAEAEQALTKEEIPPGSKAFVRNYFQRLDGSPDASE